MRRNRVRFGSDANWPGLCLAVRALLPTPEPLCRQETTILPLAAAAASQQRRSSTEGGTENWQGRKTAERGETERALRARRTEQKKEKSRSKAGGFQGARDSGGRQWTYRSGASGNSFFSSFFVSEWEKAALLAPMESQALRSVFPWMKNRAPLTGSREPAPTAQPSLGDFAWFLQWF